MSKRYFPLVFGCALFALLLGDKASAQSHTDKENKITENVEENKSTSGKKAMQLSWDELFNIVGRKVRITMPEGEMIEGKVVTIESESFMVDVKKTTNGTTYPKGKFNIQRGSLDSFELNKPTKRWRRFGTFVGLVTGIIAGVAVGNALDEPDNLGRPLKGFFATAIVVPIAGYFVGRHVDKKNMIVVEMRGGL